MTPNATTSEAVGRLILEMVLVRAEFSGPLTPNECWALKVLTTKLLALISDHIRTCPLQGETNGEKKTQESISGQGPQSGQCHHGRDRRPQAAHCRV